MSRVSYVGVLLCATLLAQSLAAQDKTSTRHGMVERVALRNSGDDIEVEIQTSGTPVSPDTQAISGPDRIVVDFPGTLPASTLRALNVNKGVLKGIRSGLFFNNPPITRIVLDLLEPRSYQVSSAGNKIVVKLGAAPAAGKPVVAANPTVSPRVRESVSPAALQGAATPHLAPASLSSGTVSPAAAALANLSHANLSHGNLASANIPSANLPGSAMARSTVVPAVVPLATPAAAPKPMSVTYQSGLLSIHAEKATLAQVLFEVHLRTQAEIAIPAGAEREEVMADLGPAPAREVLGALLNGSHYNFIFVGNELSLERVILTQKDSTNF